jgi:microcystin degradation protein MlrC
LQKYPVNGKVFMSITDAPAAELCFAAGVGAELTISLGGTLAPQFFDSVTVTGRVATLSDGVYQSKYPSKIFNSGPTVLFRVDEIEIVITSKPAFMLDYQLYLKMGLDITTAKIVQAKSAGSYRAYYEPLAFKCIDFAAPGPSDSRLPKLPFTRPRRPLWPFDRDIENGWY